MNERNAVAAIAIFALLAFSPCAFAAVVQGRIYDSSTLDLVDKAIVTASTMPEQVRVSENGSYFFEIPDGNYTITARKFDNGSLALVASEGVELRDNGTYTVDMLLLPPDEFFDIEANHTPNPLNDENLTQIENLSVEPGAAATRGAPAGGASLPVIPLAAASAALAILAAYLLLGKKQERRMGSGAALENGKPAAGAAQKSAIVPKKKAAGGDAARGAFLLSPELKMAVSILRKSGGHMTQKELRKAMPYSEAKVSLIVTELEEMKAVRKFKRGRGNIVKLLV